MVKRYFAPFKHNIIPNFFKNAHKSWYSYHYFFLFIFNHRKHRNVLLSECTYNRICFKCVSFHIHSLRSVPVSYTHLDVYKRQTISSASCSFSLSISSVKVTEIRYTFVMLSPAILGNRFAVLSSLSQRIERVFDILNSSLNIMI